METKKAKKDLLKCSNCKGALDRVEGLFALTEVKQEDAELIFSPGSGIPVIVYHCSSCGKLELFSAVAKGEVKL